MITCRRVTRWMLQALDIELPWFRRLLLGLHRCQCRSCHRFGEQIVIIDQSFAEFADSQSSQTSELGSESRARLAKLLRAHASESR